MPQSRCFLAPLLLLIFPLRTLAQAIAGSDIIVVLHGRQVHRDTREAVSGVFSGVQKSGNAYLKGQLSSIKFLFLELGPGGLFETDKGSGFVNPWLQSHLELMAPKVVMSLGHAAAVVDEVAGRLPAAGRPAWHLKCLQDACSTPGPMESETCCRFRPPAREILRYIGELKPGARRVILPHDGSAQARHVAEGLGALSTAEREVLCGRGCVIEEAPVATLVALNATAQRAAAADAFLLLPSVEGVAGAAPADVAAALGSPGLAGMVPPSVAGPGNGLVALRPHSGSSAEECGLLIAQAVDLANVRRGVEVRESEMYQLSVNARLVPAGLDWRNGMLQHNGRESWNPVELLGLEPARAVPKILCAHSYGRFYGFTFFEHAGFIAGLRAAGHSLDCLEGEQSCRGDLEVSVLYFLTKFFFTTDKTKKAIYGYSHEYIKRYMPDVVYVTDDNGLKYGVLPCFEPLANGPNPTYHECSRTQYIAAGINADVKRVYRERCREYTPTGSCAGGNFFVEPGAANSQACGACILGTEAVCQSCHDLYAKPRPVNITIHLELPSTKSTVEYMKSVKPSVRKMLIICDDTGTSRGWKDTVMRQYAQMVATLTTRNVSIDFDKDWHFVRTPAEFKQVYESYQSRSEYMIWLPSIASMLPGDAAARGAVWREFIAANKLGEVVLPGETNEALLSSAGHPDSMGRAAAQYADMVVRGLATAADLKFVPAPLAKTSVNTDRPKQLREHGIMPIPPNILAAASEIFTMCPPGKYLKEGKCEACMAGRFKGGYGDSADACTPCYSLNGMQMYSPPGSTNSSSCMCDRTYFQQTREAGVCDASSQLANTDYCCRQCLEGTFQSDRGQRSCDSCGGGTTTRFLGALDAGACQCPPGKLLLPNGTCGVCGVGEACSGWDLLAAEAEPGYMMSPRPIEGARGATPVFRCYGDEPGPRGGRRCPGGPPGTCAAGRTGYQCVECEPGKASAPDGTCVACSGGDEAPLPLAVVVCLVGAAYLYWDLGRLDVTQTSMSSLAIGICSGLLITAAQMLGVLSTLAFRWGDIVGPLLQAMKVFLLDMEVLNLSCSSAMAPQDRLLLNCVLLPLGIAALCVVHAVYCGIFHGFRVLEQKRQIVGALGQLNLLAFISYVSTVLAVFQCEGHPSGLLTNRKYPTVLCWQPGEHGSMVAVGLAFLLLPLAFLAGVAWIVWRLPGRIRDGDGNFFTMWVWAFYKFRPGVHYYVFVVLLRSFICSIIPIIPGAAGQIAFCQLAMPAFLALICFLRPWKSAFANALDAFVTLCIIVTSGMAPFFVEAPDVRIAGTVACTICALVLVLIPLAICFKAGELVVRRCAKPYGFFLCHHRVEAGAFAKLLGMHLQERRPKGVFITFAEKQDADVLFDHIRSASDIVVVLGSRGIAERPFLMGELAIAHVNDVKTVLVSLPGFELPKDALIDEYEIHCPKVSGLLASGITVQSVREAMYWMRELPRFSLERRAFDSQLLPTLVGALVTGDPGALEGRLRCTSPLGHIPRSTILADPADWEATASAHILARALGRIAEEEEAPAVLSPSNASYLFERPAERLLVICTGRSWYSPDFASLLVAAYAGAKVAVPVLAEEHFKFPDEVVYKQLEQIHSHQMDFWGHPVLASELRATMEALLSMTCYTFVPQLTTSTAAELSKSARRILSHFACQRASRKPDAKIKAQPPERESHPPPAAEVESDRVRLSL